MDWAVAQTLTDEELQARLYRLAVPRASRQLEPDYASMGTTILDRLMHRAVMLEFEGKSYRLKEAAARIALSTEHA